MAVKLLNDFSKSLGLETVNGGANLVKALFKLAETLEKYKDTQELKSAIEKINIESLLDALNSPLGSVVEIVYLSCLLQLELFLILLNKVVRSLLWKMRCSCWFRWLF